MSYCIRIGGTNEYISKIDPNDTRCFPPGSVQSVIGMNHGDVLWFNTSNEVELAADMVEYIEGYHCSIEQN